MAYNQDEILDLIDTIREDTKNAENLRDEIERLEDELQTSNRELQELEKTIADDRRRLDTVIDQALEAPLEREVSPGAAWASPYALAYS